MGSHPTISYIVHITGQSLAPVTTQIKTPYVLFMYLFKRVANIPRYQLASPWEHDNFITNLLYIRKELFETVVAFTFNLMQIFKAEHLTARNKHATYTWSTSPIVIEPPYFSYCLNKGKTTNFSLWGINPILITRFYLSFTNVPHIITLLGLINWLV